MSPVNRRSQKTSLAMMIDAKHQAERHAVFGDLAARHRAEAVRQAALNAARVARLKSSGGRIIAESDDIAD